MKRSLLLLTACLVFAWSFVTSVGVTSGQVKDDLKKKSVSVDRSSVVKVKELCHIKLIKIVVLASERPGIIDFIKPKEGDVVSNDELIIGLRSEVAKAALASAVLKSENDIDIRFAKSQRDVSQVEYDLTKRAKELRSAAVTDLELKTAELKLERSSLQIEQAQKQMEIDKLARDEAVATLKSYQIRSPWQGIVTKLHKKFRGEAVSQGEPILEMANTEYVHIQAEIPLKDALRIKQGDLAEVRLNIPEMDLEIEKITKQGRVVFVDITTKRVTYDVMIKVKIKNPNNMFREGLYASMIIYPGVKGPKFEDEKPESTGPTITLNP